MATAANQCGYNAEGVTNSAEQLPKTTATCRPNDDQAQNSTKSRNSLNINNIAQTLQKLFVYLEKIHYD